MLFHPCDHQAMSEEQQKPGRPKTGSKKIRPNFSLSPETFEMLKAEAERKDVSMSALLTLWIREKIGRDLRVVESREAKSSRSGQA
jgi:hypothetical protein